MCKNTTTPLFIVFGVAMTAVAALSIHYRGMVGVACVGSLLLVGIIIAYMSRSFTCRRSSSSDAERQQASEDEEDQDSPPSYDVVTAKPPPYYLLYDTNSPSTDGVTADGIPDAVICHTPIGLGPLDLDHKKNVWQRSTWSLLAPPETSPPSFAQAVRSSLGWTTPETEATPPAPSHSGSTPSPPSHSGSTPPAPPHCGSTPISSPDSGSTPLSPLDSGSVPMSPLDSGSTPISALDGGDTRISVLDSGSTPISPLDSGSTPISVLDSGSTHSVSNCFDATSPVSLPPHSYPM